MSGSNKKEGEKNVDDFIEKNYEAGSYFIVPRDLIDGTYPNGYLTHEQIQLLLLIFAFRDERHFKRHGMVTIGVEAFDKYIRPIRSHKDAKKEVEKGIETLVKKGFLFPSCKATTSFKYAISLPPLYDIISRTPIQRYIGEVCSNSNIIKRKLPFIRLPKILIENKIITPRNKNLCLGINHINILLLLYRYNFLETYGGVDMKFIHRENGKLYIKPNILMNLYMDNSEGQAEFVEVLDYFEKIQLIRWVKVVVEKNTFICDYNLFNQNDLTEKHRIVEIIRPYYQPYFMKENVK